MRLLLWNGLTVAAGDDSCQRVWSTVGFSPLLDKKLSRNAFCAWSHFRTSFNRKPNGGCAYCGGIQ